jgi:hypothetical protein
VSYYNKEKGSNTSNQIKELEQSMPEIILANFHQLVRRYQNALTWISSAGETNEHLTRWKKFRLPIMKYSAIRTFMSKIIAQIAETDSHCGKYSFINYSNIRFDINNNIERLHVEARFCDGMLTPSAVASFGILVYAMFLKAVSLSKYGVLQSGDVEYMDKAKIIEAALLNGDNNWGSMRVSDTSEFGPYKEIVRAQAAEMIDILYDELKNHGPSVQVLKSLADEPCSIRRIRGDSWEKIENDLSSFYVPTINEATLKILEAIDTMFIYDCLSIEEWAKTLSEDVLIPEEDILNSVKNMASKHIISWDNAVGTFVRS